MKCECGWWDIMQLGFKFNLLQEVKVVRVGEGSYEFMRYKINC
jgi:hypothetical protein